MISRNHSPRRSLRNSFRQEPFIDLSVQRFFSGGEVGTLQDTFLPRFVLVLISTLLGLLLAEGVVRLLAPQPLTIPWADEVSGVLAPRANVRGREYVPHTYDVTVSFNSQRFRGQREYQPQPGPGVTRIATLGDSVTFGNGANDDQTYPAQLEGILQGRSIKKGLPVTYEVINAGIGGTGTAEQALWYENWVKQFHPHLVVLNVFCNDVDGDLMSGLFYVDPKGRVSPRPRDEIRAAGQRFRGFQKLVGNLPGYRFLAEHSQLASLLRTAIGGVIDHRRKAALLKQSLPPSPIGHAERFHEQGLPRLAGEVSWLKEQVQASGSRLTVVFVPCRETIYSSQALWAHEVQQESPSIVACLRELTSKDGIPFTDLTPVIRERAGQLDEPLYYNGPLDTHPTPKGYRIIAEAVAAFLSGTRVIPIPPSN
ncbi:MAG: hypothetical protein DMG06_25770 [Acidobacteria bacterium]|nr:MAG: hypothetical protein DMG06_25770 [Acidobacteriota bacterium]